MGRARRRLAREWRRTLLAGGPELPWGRLSRAELCPPDLHHRHGDVIVDNNAFVLFSGQY